MTIDGHGRNIDYLRISVTDRCNYRCVYCMPEEGVRLKGHDEILTFEEIVRIAGAAGELGFRKLRLTGGEPLVRKNIERLVGMISNTGYYDDISMTTNGTMLSPVLALTLRDVGLSRVNISLDTLDSGRFAEITRGGDIDDVFAGIEAAKRARFDPVKINMIIFDTTTMEEVESMRAFCGEHDLLLQTIKHFSLYRMVDSGQVHSFDRPMPCSRCDRLRLTADGYFKPCLFSDHEIKVDMDDIKGSILKSVREKPLEGSSCCNRSMYQIGG
ncbi:MAG: radical SAM protein [Candidatus Krumholzibacteria bacterium]|nr:radical SAM protein [Candidatus Krumholzibacteria bacterium]